jgi:misacylated tRNA(Ala) deacylase
MQQHTAQHLISSLAMSRLNADTASWSLGKDVCTIDFSVPKLSPDDLGRLEDLVNEEIRQAKTVQCHEVRTEEDKAALLESVRSRGLPTNLPVIRLIEISGVDMNTCCGTHVRNLSELQMIKFVGTEPKKGMVRVSFLAGDRLSRAVSAWTEREKKLNITLQCAAVEHVAAATRINNDVKSLMQQKRKLMKDLAVFIGQNAVREGHKLVDVHRDDADMSFLQATAKAAQDAAGAAASELVLFLSFSDGEGGQFILQGPQALVNETGKQVSELLQGKGGGRGNTFQGRAGSFKRRSEVVDLLRSRLAGSNAAPSSS